MDRIGAMTAFVRVVEAGSFTKAAITLKVPKVKITRLIQQLEAFLEVRLVHRTTRALTLTAEGAAYYERAVGLLRDLADLEAGAKSSRAKPSGRINVEVSVAIGAMVIVPALGDFYEKHPGIEINLSSTNRNVDLVAENLDCAIRIGPIQDQTVVARRIGGFEFSTSASPAYIERRGTPEHPRDLMKAHNTIGMFSNRLSNAVPFVFSRGEERFELSPEHLFQANDTNALLSAAVAGLGIMHAPSFAAHAAIASGRLVPILEDWRSDVYSVNVIYPPNRYLSAKVRVFVDWVVGAFERSPILSLRSVPAISPRRP